LKALAKRGRKRIVHPEGWVRPDSSELLDLSEYDLIVVALSGGKDSVACLLEVIRRCDELGVPRSRIEAWHQCVDGAPGSESVWDWPVTDAYCAALCRVLGVTFRRQWRDGGLTAELAREYERTRPVRFELADGTVGTTGGTDGPLGTRGVHPAQSADLASRWCSPAVKIDVCAGAVCNDPRLATARVLMVTGERRQESTNRASYATVERGRGTNKKRRVDQWRIILEWTEAQVWDCLKARRIVCHPAYRIGFGRCSCLTCIFNGHDEWATVRKIAPKPFEYHVEVEVASGSTIRKGLTVIEQADLGTPLPGTADPALVALAMGTEYPDALVLVPDGEEWVLPIGAFRVCGGPT
jgi:3'-phosphoadenosine 5'-phosphosulfate sulfotransferase (PAPS reductase)/FAD synthetase